VSDNRGITLVISFSGIEGYFQVRLKNQTEEVALFSQEGAKRLVLRQDTSGKYLYCEFELGLAKTSAKVPVLPKISVKWNTLLNFGRVRPTHHLREFTVPKWCVGRTLLTE